jgi:hypothetical protein
MAEYCEPTFCSGLAGGTKYNHIGFRIILNEVK